VAEVVQPHSIQPEPATNGSERLGDIVGYPGTFTDRRLRKYKAALAELF
jgi:hypothetical protein